MIEFAAIAQERSFVRASQRLRVGQPWLSARLAKLENILGFRLLHRTTRSVTLTERGAAFLPVAEEMARLSQTADRLSLQLGRRERRVLRIGAAPSTKTSRHRHELLNDFALAHTDVSLELESAWSLPLLAKLEAGEIDLSFMMGEVDTARFERIVLAHYGLAVTVGRSHQWAQRPSIAPGELDSSRLQVFTRNLNPGLWDMLYAPLTATGCRFVEMPEMAEGAPFRMRATDDVAAFFDFGSDDPGGADVVRIPVRSAVAVPFQLLRSVNHAADGGRLFWDMAFDRAERGEPSGTV
ncbi:LysR family transcriptional regulator [Sphingobium sp. AN641]|uniref:LysR family transcriptional regulator n=1 Tax=Sphingobium sp. AN641 TaxID=3133443 RepID=UPI0030C1A4F3